MHLHHGGGQERFGKAGVFRRTQCQHELYFGKFLFHNASHVFAITSLGPEDAEAAEDETDAVVNEAR